MDKIYNYDQYLGMSLDFSVIVNSTLDLKPGSILCIDNEVVLGNRWYDDLALSLSNIISDTLLNNDIDGDGGREITIVFLIFLLSFILSAIIGVAAGMTISIHYFENTVF